MVNHPNTILARQGLTSGMKRVPVPSLCYDRRHGTFVNVCHIGKNWALVKPVTVNTRDGQNVTTIRDASRICHVAVTDFW